MSKYIHLIFLPLWLGGLYWSQRTLESDRHHAVSLGLVNEPAEHVAAIEKALALNPWNGFALASMGRVMTARENWAEVLRYTNRALDSAFYIDLIRQRGNALLQLGERQGDSRLAAYDEYQKLLLFLPDDRDTLYRLMRLALRLDRLDEAEAYGNRLLSANPPASDVWYEMNLIQARQQQYRESLHSVHRFFLLGPSENLGPEVFTTRDWKKHLLQWDRYLPTVEAGKMKPAEGGTMQTERGRARAGVEKR